MPGSISASNPTIKSLDDARRRRSGGRRGRRQQHDPRLLGDRRRRVPGHPAQSLRLARHDEAVSRRSRSTSSATSTASGACTPTNTSPAARRSSSSAATRRGAPPDSIARPRMRARRFSSGSSPTSSQGHTLVTNRSIWRQFPTIVTRPWSVGNVVLIGDAAHTAHFSVGSGTRMAMEDAVALRNALTSGARARNGNGRELTRCARALQRLRSGAPAAGREPAARGTGVARVVRGDRALHERSRRCSSPSRCSRGRCASLTRTCACAIPGFSPRSMRSSPTRRRARRVSRAPPGRAPPPMFTPFRLRDLVIPNRVVMSPMCQYVADDGTVGDWHLVHLGSRADRRRRARHGGDDRRLARGAHLTVVRRPLRRRDTLRRGSASSISCTSQSAAKIGIQLGHAGRKGATKRLWEGDNEPLEAGSAGRWCPRRRFPTSRIAVRCRAR